MPAFLVFSRRFSFETACGYSHAPVSCIGCLRSKWLPDYSYAPLSCIGCRASVRNGPRLPICPLPAISRLFSFEIAPILHMPTFLAISRWRSFEAVSGCSYAPVLHSRPVFIRVEQRLVANETRAVSASTICHAAAFF